jgi:hypothetical protein
VTEKTSGPEPVCSFPGCERPADPESGGVLEVCREHATVMYAAADVEDWEVALRILKPWVKASEAIGIEKLTEVMERALAEAETALEFARGELERAEKAAL